MSSDDMLVTFIITMKIIAKSLLWQVWFGSPTMEALKALEAPSLVLTGKY